MKHQKLPDIKGTVTLELQLEDWAWLCDLLTRTLRYGEHDKYSKEDTEYLLRILEEAESSIFE